MAGVALTLATEYNVDRIMTDLEQSQKRVAQLKENLKKERGESHNLKRKYEDMINEVTISKEECQTLHEDKYALVVSVENMERNSQATSAKLGKIQLKYQSLEDEKNHLQLLVEELNK